MPERTSDLTRSATKPKGRPPTARRAAPATTKQAVPRRSLGVSNSSRASLEQGLLLLLAVGRRGIVVVLALAVLIIFTAGVFEQRWKEQQVQAQVAAQRASLEAAQARNVQLQGQLAESDPAAYRAWVEDTARRQLNLGYNGETIFLVNWTTPAAAPAASPTPAPVAASSTTTQPQGEAHWRQWLHLIFGD
jgi:cell division protein FtsB